MHSRPQNHSKYKHLYGLGLKTIVNTSIWRLRGHPTGPGSWPRSRVFPTNKKKQSFFLFFLETLLAQWVGWGGWLGHTVAFPMIWSPGGTIYLHLRWFGDA